MAELSQQPQTGAAGRHKAGLTPPDPSPGTEGTMRERTTERSRDQQRHRLQTHDDSIVGWWLHVSKLYLLDVFIF